MASLLRLLRSNAAIAYSRRATVVHRRGRLLRNLTLHIRLSILGSWSVTRSHVMMPDILRMTIVATCRLRNIRDNLHPARDDTSWASAARGIRRCRRSSETFRKLFQEGAGNIISCDMHSVSNSQNDKRAFS